MTEQAKPDRGNERKQDTEGNLGQKEARQQAQSDKEDVADERANQGQEQVAA